ncbi:MAG: hypothetical protein EXR73_04170 [Myxococcales bacterium]|nr:hypothetical protein [Myxococcales bacterium]
MASSWCGKCGGLLPAIVPGDDMPVRCPACGDDEAEPSSSPVAEIEPLAIEGEGGALDLGDLSFDDDAHDNTPVKPRPREASTRDPDPAELGGDSGGIFDFERDLLGPTPDLLSADAPAIAPPFPELAASLTEATHQISELPHSSELPDGFDLPDVFDAPAAPEPEPDNLLAPAPRASQSRRAGVVAPLFDLPDLLAPVGPESRLLPDLLAPIGPESRRLPDLLAPVGPESRRLPDLLAPVGPESRRLPDLFAPARSSEKDARSTTKLSLAGLADPEAPLALDGDSSGVVDEGAVLSFDKVRSKTPADNAALSLAAVAFTPPAPEPSRLHLAEPLAGGQTGSSTLTVEAAARRRVTVARTKRRVRVGALLTVLAVTGVAYYAFNLYEERTAQTGDVQANLAEARRLLALDGPAHWDLSGERSRKARGLDPRNAPAIGLAAQAGLAAYLETGLAREQRVGAANDLLSAATRNGLRGTEIEVALALKSLAVGRAMDAARELALLAQQTHDLTVAMFHGWAALAALDGATAKRAFGTVLAEQPQRVPALYGLARAHLLLDEPKEATTALARLLCIDDPTPRVCPDKSVDCAQPPRNPRVCPTWRTSHVGAKLTLIELQPHDREGLRRAALRALLDSEVAAGKSADPRELARAWVLLGDETRALGATSSGEALTFYRKALALDGEAILAQLGAALSLLGHAQNHQQLDDARTELESVLARPDGASLIPALLGVVEASLRKDPPDLSVARDRANQAMLIAANSAAPRYWSGRVFAGAGNPRAAEDAFRKAIALDATYLPANIALAQILYSDLDEARRNEAVALLSPVEESARQDSQLANLLGLAYLGARRPEQARPWFEKAFELDPRLVDSLANLGAAHELSGDLDSAIARFEEAWTVDRAQGGLRENLPLRLARALERRKRGLEAWQIYEQLLGAERPTLEVRAAAGRFLAERGTDADLEQVARLGNEILTEAPRHPAGLFLRARVLMVRDAAAAQRLVAEAVVVDPRAQYYVALGSCYEHMNALADALSAFQRAVELDDIYAPAYIGRARVRLVTHTWAEALTDLERAAVLVPDRAEIDIMTGRARVGLGTPADLKLAILAYQRGLQKEPRLGEAHYLLAELHRDAGDRPDLVRTHLERAVALSGETAGSTEWIWRAWMILGYLYKDAREHDAMCAAFAHFDELAPNNIGERIDVQGIRIRCPGR